MAAKLVNMKLDPKEREKMPECAVADRPQYPWGLCLNLDDESMKKLGLAALPRVGKPVMITALADVTSVSENEYTTPDGKTEKRQSVSLQITDLGLSDGSEMMKADPKEKLYS